MARTRNAVITVILTGSRKARGEQALPERRARRSDDDDRGGDGPDCGHAILLRGDPQSSLGEPRRGPWAGEGGAGTEERVEKNATAQAELLYTFASIGDGCS